ECEFNVELFDPETIDSLIYGYGQVLQQLVTQPETKLADFRLPDTLTTRARAARRREQKQSIAIASTFTAEPLEESLAFWMRQLEIPSEIEFAPYNQVFQQLLDPSSLLARNTSGANIVLVRLEDWKKSEKNGAGLPIHQQIE